MSENMVERVAIAIGKAEGYDSVTVSRKRFAKAARAAIEAMNPATEAMLSGACDKHLPGRPMHDTTPPWPDERHRTKTECPRIVTRRRIWQRMIDAALA